MRALITGGNGFVGKLLAKKLLENNYNVAVTDIIESNISNAYKTYQLNILDKERVESVIKDFNPDVIFHLAAQSSVASSWKEPEKTIDINISGTLNILEVLKNIEYKGKLLLIGSSEEYGSIDYSKPVIEESILKPGNIYAATKVMQEMLGNIYYKAHGLQILMTRSFNHIGAGQAPIFVVSDFAKQIAEIEKGLREPVIRVGNLDAERDFTDVHDVVDAYILLAEKGVCGEAYNVGSGNAIKIEKILNNLLAKSNKCISIEVDESRFRPVDIPVIRADISKLQAHTGWKPVVSIDNSLQDVLDYWRSTL